MDPFEYIQREGHQQVIDLRGLKASNRPGSRENNFQNIRLTPIMRDIKLNYQAFEWPSFSHILRELNSKADDLSKGALDLHNDTFVYYEYFKGVEMKAMEIRF